MKNNNNDEAVSLVISLILMLAVTIILAAVISAFVSGMAGDQHKNRALGISAKLHSGDVVLTLVPGTNEDLGALDSIDVYLNGVKQAAAWSPDSIGDSTTYAGSYAKGDKIRLIGHFYPNDEQIILYDSTL